MATLEHHLKELEALLPCLEASVQASFELYPILPLLCVHPPPSKRDTHANAVNAQLDNLDTSLHRMKVVETAVHRIRTAVRRQRAHLATSLSPAGALPLELLRTIFPFIANSESIQGVRNVSMVNRGWRDVAIHQRALWTWIKNPLHVFWVPLSARGSEVLGWGVAPP